MAVRAFPIADLLERRREAGQPWYEFVAGRTLTVGIYVLEAGAVDGQEPHAEDEVYVILAGRSRFTAAGETIDVAPGDTIHVPAGVPHRFHDIGETLHIVYTLTPAEARGG